MCFKNVKKCEKKYFLKQFWSFVLFSFFIWFYVFAPGSHCFAKAKLNRSAICTVHFRSIWTAPLRFSTCRSWAGSKVTAAKLEPQKIKPEEKEIRVPPSQLDFPNVFITFFTLFSHLFRIFCTFFRIFSSACSKHIFSHFFQVHFRVAFFHVFKTHFFTFFPDAFSKHIFSHV